VRTVVVGVVVVVTEDDDDDDLARESSNIGDAPLFLFSFFWLLPSFLNVVRRCTIRAAPRFELPRCCGTVAECRRQLFFDKRTALHGRRSKRMARSKAGRRASLPAV
jgi:hypothetical protein